MSLESIEIVMNWEESFGISLSEAEVSSLRTPRQTMDLIAEKLEANDELARPCLTLRAFGRLRHAIADATNLPLRQIQTKARLTNLVKSERGRTWESVRTTSGIPSLPGLWWFSTSTLSDFTRWTVTHAAKDVKPLGEAWTRTEIRTVVRAGIMDIIGEDDFADDDDYIDDLRLD